MADNFSLDFYKLKVFLYKYTPVFNEIVNPTEAKANQKTLQQFQTRPITTFVRLPDGRVIQQNTEEVTVTNAPSVLDQEALFKIDRYTIELDEKKYFRKFDISDFISSYNFNQELGQNTFAWSVVLQNTILTFDQLNSIKVEGDKVSTDTITTLAQYEAQARHAFDTSFIANGKTNRGKVTSAVTQDSLTQRIGPSTGTKQGLRLSDLIQPYDIISVFLYKGNQPVEELTGFKTKLASADGPVVFVVDDSSISGLTTADLRTETILMSPNPSGSNTTLFSNEFNGFVLTKSTNSSVNAVDIVTVSGNGITRLFGATRRLLKSSALQRSIYDINEIVDQFQYSAFQNTYVGKKLEDIFIDLFNIVYRIKPNVSQKPQTQTGFVNGQEVTAVNTSSNGENVTPIFNDVPVPESTYYDISTMVVSNQFQTNPFSIPPFLLALVMKRHGFNYREPKNSSSLQQLLTAASKEIRRPTVVLSSFLFGADNQPVGLNDIARTSTDLVLDQNAIDRAINSNTGLQNKKGVISPVFFSEELNTLRPYFRFVEDVLTFFNPELKTPFEIIDELRSKTFLEFFERPDGRIIIRSPQYNDTAETIFSSTLNMISTNYNESATSLLSRQKVGYAADIINEIATKAFFSYVDGKFLLQFGQLEGAADANPNAKDDKPIKPYLAEKNESGLIRYAEYLLRLSNAALKTATIVMDYDQRIVIGRTFFDETNSKFGYIIGASKNVSAGSGVTLTITLSYVRDAIQVNVLDPSSGDIIPTLQFQQLDRLVDIAQDFTNSNVDKTVSNPEPTVNQPLDQGSNSSTKTV